MRNLRVLLFRKDGKSHTVCLEESIESRGDNDSHALELLVEAVANPMYGLNELSPEAVAEYEQRFNVSERESKTVRGEFILQVRAG